MMFERGDLRRLSSFLCLQPPKSRLDNPQAHDNKESLTPSNSVSLW